MAVAGELHPVPGAELLRKPGECLGDIGTPAGGLTFDGLGFGALLSLTVFQHQLHGAGRCVDGFNAVPNAGTRTALLRLAKHYGFRLEAYPSED